ncbi:hypothetical protein AgCh_014390 [Apium graveolens]
MIPRQLTYLKHQANHFTSSFDRKGGASYTWFGIWEAEEEMKKGLRWVVGDGKSIRVVHDRWLRTKNDYCVNINEVRGDASSLKVCDLFQENKKEWDLSKLRSYFSSEDVDAILKTRIPQSFAKECWLKLGINVDSWDIEISHEWLLQKLATGSKEETLKIVTVLWGVWFTRNKRIFENKVMTPDFVMAWSRRQIVEWQEANRKVQDIDTRIAENREAENIWQTPTKGCLKINVDASFVEGQDYYLIGMVPRNHLGQYLLGRTSRSIGLLENMGISPILFRARSSSLKVLVIRNAAATSFYPGRLSTRTYGERRNSFKETVSTGLEDLSSVYIFSSSV